MQVQTRQPPDYSAALAFLERDPHTNRELLVALRYEVIAELRLVRRAEQVAGVLLRGQGMHSAGDEWIQLDAADHQAVDELFQGVVPAQMTMVLAHRAWIGEHLVARHGFAAVGPRVLGSLLDADNLQPNTDRGARLLTPSDRALVERSGCGWNDIYFQQLFVQSRRPWGLIRDGRIVCRASSGYRHGDTEEVVGVWTHPRWRGRGLARALVSAVAADILSRVSLAAYRTTEDNLASQAVASAVGFRPSFTITPYHRPH